MTSKELAKQMGLSEAAVSLALNNKKGVSTKTRIKVREAAEAAGMDLSDINIRNNLGIIYLIRYKKHGAILKDSTFFTAVTDGIEQGCSAYGYKLNIINIYTPSELQKQLEDSYLDKISGMIVLGTEMQSEDFFQLGFAQIPVILLDNHFISSKIDSICINNVDGMYEAANYLINRCKVRPGYLSSSYPIYNFSQRHIGFNNALVYNGMSTSNVINHAVTPSVDGAYNDMLEIIKRGDELASCYCADNDFIAIGAMRAFKASGFRIPDDISIIGFDDIPYCEYSEPGLTTVHVPKHYLGLLSVERLNHLINTKASSTVNITVATHIVLRDSIRKNLS